MLTYDSAVFDFAKDDRVAFRSGNGLHVQGHRSGVVTAVGLRLIHVKSDQDGQTYHVVPRLIDHV
jgi:hypothetical protein